MESLALVVITIMGILLAISTIAISVVLYNFLLLLSELNKRQVCIISDILGSINLETPHLDTISPTVPIPNVDDVIEDEGETYFNPHEFDIDQYEGNNS